MTTTEDFLSHYGVKGMKWGVHNGEAPAGASRSERKAAGKASKAAYKDWKKEVGGEKVANEIFQDATKSFGSAVKIINNDPHFKGKDLTKDRKLAREYDSLTAQVFNQHLATASIERTITNTGRAMIYQFDRNLGMMRAQESQLVIGHADNEGYPDFVAEMDEQGHIISLNRTDEDPFVEQMEAATDFLSHYGVKGMKWGTRKGEGGGSSKSGAVKEAPSEDAARVGSIHGRVKSQKSTRMLSNKELQDAITRMNLEQQYSRMTGGLDKTRKQKVSSFVRDTINNLAKQQVTNVVNTQVKEAVEKHTKTGKYDPSAVAEREAKIATAQARTRAANAS